MILMALDHTRDYFSNFPYNPTDLGHTHTAMFFTRWITHFCAPVFVFLAGTSAFLNLQRGKSKKSMSSQLFFRGLWLIVLELTIIRWGWVFNLDYTTVFVQVIWAIGWSMICLSMLIWLPYRIIFLFSILMIGGHNMLDRMEFANNGNLWGILHSGGDIKLFESINVWVMYPLIPWIAVMSAGYCFGRIYTLPASDRNPLDLWNRTECHRSVYPDKILEYLWRSLSLGNTGNRMVYLLILFKLYEVSPIPMLFTHDLRTRYSKPSSMGKTSCQHK